VSPEHISELFAAFGRVDVRSMFGGTGIYAEGVMFGLVVDDVIYLKTDERTAARFEQEGCGPFTYGPALRRPGGAGRLGQRRAEGPSEDSQVLKELPIAILLVRLRGAAPLKHC
jgi:DNA transformation protein and related proteins